MKERIEFYTNTYQYNAFADFIVRKHIDYEKWVNNNFVQIVGASNDDVDISVDYLCGNIYGHLPLLKIIDNSHNKKDREQTIKVIKEGLCQDKVFYVFLDQYYLEGTPFYLKEHSDHDVLLIRKEDGFFVYLENVDGFIKEFALEEKAFWSNFFENDNNCIFEVSVNENVRYEFDINRLILMLEDYLYSRTIEGKEKVYLPECDFYSDIFFTEKKQDIDHFGISVYDMIYQKTVYRVQQKRFLDYRMYYLVYEKNVNLIKRLQYCNRLNYLGKSRMASILEEIENMCKIQKVCLSRAIKYAYGRNSKGMDIVCSNLLNVKEREIEIYKRVLDILIGKN